MITIRIVAIILILTIVNSASAQGEHKSPEVMKDAIGMFEFQESSIELSEKGRLELDRFAKWYLSNSNQLLYRVYLGGVVSTEEVSMDHFLGVKRCKVILDTFVQFGVDVSVFFIVIDRVQSQGQNHGVSFNVDTNGGVQPDSRKEDDYFKTPKKKRKG